MPGKYVNGKEKSVHATGSEKPLKVFLPDELEVKYTVEKLSTSGLPATWSDPQDGNTEYEIKWVNNFNLKVNAGYTPDETTSVDYEIQFDKPSLGKNKNQRMFLYANGQVIPVNKGDFQEFESGTKVAGRLRMADPAAGWGGS